MTRRLWHRLFGHGFYVVSDLKVAVLCKCGDYVDPSTLDWLPRRGYEVYIINGWRIGARGRLRRSKCL